MSIAAWVAIVAVCVAVPLLLVSSFYFVTVRMVRSGGERRFADELAEQRQLVSALGGLGAALAFVSVVAFAGSLLGV